MPTALELGPDGWKAYAPVARRPGAREHLEAESPTDRERVVGQVRDAAREIKRNLPGCRILLFGSLAHGHGYGSHSDVDVAVEGVEGEAYWAVWRILEEHVSDRTVDLVSVETASTSLRTAIFRAGIEL